jgi:hypothetical protein
MPRAPVLVAVLAALAVTAGAAPGRAAAVTIAWGGDTTLGSSHGFPPDRGRPQLAAVAPVLRAADLAIVNLEGTFAPGGASKCAGPDGGDCFAFQAPPGNAATLAWAGVDIVDTANNHAYDYGPAGWSGTRAALRRAGVRATGAPGEIAVMAAGGTKVAVVGFSTYAWSAPMRDPTGVRALVRRAARRAPIVVALLHAGAEGADRSHTPMGSEHAYGEDRGNVRAFARTAIAAGADLVLGSGPHVLRGMEIVGSRLVAYSLGNLTGWHNFGTGGLSALSAVVTVDVGPTGRLRTGRLTSLRLDRAGVPALDPSDAAAALVRARSDQDFGRRSPWAPRAVLLAPPLVTPPPPATAPPSAPATPPSAPATPPSAPAAAPPG